MSTIKIFDGTAWQTMQVPAGSGATTWVGPDPPPYAFKVGDLWYDTDDVSTLVLPMSVVNGGTGATTAAAARTSLAMPGEELAYNQVTAPVSITATSQTSPNLVIEGTTRTYDGSPVMVEVNIHNLSAMSAATQVYLSLWDGAIDLGYISATFSTAGTQLSMSFHAKRRVTPTPGSHTYRVLGIVTSGSGSAYAGPGGVAQWSPMYVRVTRA